MKRLFVLIFAAQLLLLSSCTPAQQQQAKSEANDTFLNAQIRAKITGIDAATVSTVGIAVANGNVKLSGMVRTKSERAEIEKAARSTSGVHRVSDSITVNPNAPTAKEVEDDIALQTRVKAALTEQTGVNAFDVQVSVHRGVVLLEGSVRDNTVHTLVLETVHGVQGVHQVVDHLRLKKI